MKTILVVFALLWAGLAQAAGFAVDVHSARAVGMAQTMKAHVDDASAVFFNPAGLVMGRQLDIQVGDTLIIPSFKIEDKTGTYPTQNQVIPPVHLYAAYGLNDDISVGVGMFSLFGLVVPYAPDWVGRSESVRSDLKTYFINPEIAARVLDRVRVGAGVQIVRATAQLNRALIFGNQEGAVNLGGGGWGVGGNAGVMVDIIPRRLTFGATYRSPVTVDISGRAHFSGIPAEFQSTIYDQKATTTAHLPQTFGFGLAFWPIAALRLAIDADYTGWQTIGDLTIRFPETPPVPPSDLGQLDTRLPKRWSHACLVRTGGEYSLTEQWRLRAGVMYDGSPSPADTITPELPDANRINLGIGAGYRWYNFNFDLGYQLVILMSNQSTAPTVPIGPATYSGTANILSFTLGYRM